VAGYGADARALAIRSGALGVIRARLPRTRIQSMSVRQNPFQRRAGLATLTATTVIGSAASTHRVRHLPVADAVRIAEWYSPSQREATR
jgi:putative membrane protein